MFTCPTQHSFMYQLPYIQQQESSEHVNKAVLNCIDINSLSFQISGKMYPLVVQRPKQQDLLCCHIVP